MIPTTHITSYINDRLNSCVSTETDLANCIAYEHTDVDMDADDAGKKPTERSIGSLKRQKANKAARIEKKRHRKVKNSVVFPVHPKKPKAKKR